MIIVSKFRDYYDSVATHGVADDLRYIRVSKIVEKLKTYGNTYCETSPVVIGFCGKIYFCHVFNKFSLNQEYYYTLDDIKNRLLTKDPRERDGYRYVSRRYRGNNKHWEEIFYKQQHESWKQYQHLFLKYQVPIFKQETIREDNNYYRILELNPRLNLYEFYRVIDPYTAYQEIAMFLGGMASPEKPIPKIDDKIMAEAKGFNKYSFRKDKQK